MPKASWNIKDFSGGFNTFVDKRDIADNESSAVTDLISYNPGSLKLTGVFIKVSGDDVLGFPDNNSVNKSQSSFTLYHLCNFVSIICSPFSLHNTKCNTFYLYILYNLYVYYIYYTLY